MADYSGELDLLASDSIDILSASETVTIQTVREGDYQPATGEVGEFVVDDVGVPAIRGEMVEQTTASKGGRRRVVSVSYEVQAADLVNTLEILRSIEDGEAGEVRVVDGAVTRSVTEFTRSTDDRIFVFRCSDDD